MASNAEETPSLRSVSRAIMEETREALLVALRFMGPALYAMPFVNVRLKHAALATDGRRVGIDALRVVRTFRDDPNELLRQYLHLVLHCVYRHAFDHDHPRWAWWDIACDTTVGATALELLGQRYPCKGDDDRWETLHELEAYCQAITAPKLYHALAGVYGVDKGASGSMPAELAERLKALFACDEHAHWPRRESPFNPDEKERDEWAEDPDAEGDAEAGEDAETEFDFEEWESISKLIEQNLEVFRNQPSFEPGTLVVNLKKVNRRKSDYRQFLKRFASLAEEVMASPDEFDYIYYTYGLGLYENMPLVEPLEYHEALRVREFVIAIDTSASCSGDTVRHFVEQTYGILKSAGGFGTDINVHIIQCDAQIRSVMKVRSADDLDGYFTDFKMRGFGNTDFRPVFDYVDNAISTGEFHNLKGIVYLTDGEGEYPTYRPAYDAVFVFVDDNPRYITHVPPWASKVIMDEDELIEL